MSINCSYECRLNTLCEKADSLQKELSFTQTPTLLHTQLSTWTCEAQSLMQQCECFSLEALNTFEHNTWKELSLLAHHINQVGIKHLTASDEDNLNTTIRIYEHGLKSARIILPYISNPTRLSMINADLLNELAESMVFYWNIQKI
jgi:hypothetical protein